MAKLLRLDVAQLTDVGRKREHNEDNMAYVIPKDPVAMMHKGALFIVADGMGGHAAGEVASEIAVDTVSNAYYQDDNDDVPAALLHAIRRANAAIHQRAAENMLRSGMGTTCVAAVLRGNVAYIANVGDSRAYLVRKSRIRQVSQDHSWVAEQVRAGLLTEEQARTHAQRNVITRSLGTQPEVEIDIFREPLEEGDTLVLCSDGLSGSVNDDDLMRIIDQFVPQESVYHLVERANDAGGPDNITAIVARAMELGAEPPGVRQPVSVGGPEFSHADTARLFAQQVSTGMNTSPRNSEMLIPGSPFPYNTSGSLASSESPANSQPSAAHRPSRGRLFYPTLVLLLLLLLVAGGSGVYYFIHTNQTASINQTLNAASQSLNRANSEVSSNPAQALQLLSNAQQQLQSVKNGTLSPDQTTRLNTLQGQLVTETKSAITIYNTDAKIVPVPCTNTTPSSLVPNATNTQAQTITLIQGNGNTLYYALGQDGIIYQLNSSGTQYSMSASSFPATGVRVLSFASSNAAKSSGKLFALSEHLTNNTPSSYTLDLLTPDAKGILSDAKSQSIDASLLANGNAPDFITAWESNVYVALSSKTNPNTVSILSYSVDTTKNTFGPSATTSAISVTENVIGITAFPNQLFFLLSDGEVWSSQIHSQSLSTPLTPVLLNTPLNAPLTTGAQNFNASTAVPTTTPTSQKGSSSLTISPPTTANPPLMSAGTVESDNQTHLFIGDPANHRVLNMIILLPAFSSGPGSPTPSTTSTSNNNVTLSLVKQYVSLTALNTVKSVAINPSGSNINILGLSTSNTANANLVTVSTDPNQACAS